RERAQNDEFVNDAAARPDHGLAVSAYIPRKADAGSQIVVIGVVDFSYLNPFLHQSRVRIETAENVISVVNDAAEFVAHSEVECESRSNAPVILDEKGIHHAPDVRLRVAVEQRSGFQSAGCSAYGNGSNAVRSDDDSRCRAIAQCARYIVWNRVLPCQEGQ